MDPQQGMRTAIMHMALYPGHNMTEVAAHYRVDDLEPHEAWLAQVFQPCHEAYFTNLPRGPLKWYLHDREPLPVDANVAILTAKNPNYPGSWKEALVYRELRMVQVGHTPARTAL